MVLRSARADIQERQGLKGMSKEEMLEIWDWETGLPTGKAVERTHAHYNGIAHEGVHLWVVRTAGAKPSLLFQQRAGFKESYPGCLDITVGGHVPFGLEKNKIQKEAFEEIGIDPSDDDLVDLGHFRYEEHEEKGRFHREFQRVYLLVDNRSLDQYRFTDGEVEAIFAVPLEELESMMERDGIVRAEGYEGREVTVKTLTRKDFHPLLFAPSMEKYMEVVISAVKELIDSGCVTRKMPS
jgi:isopentenyldiphosphate isomerase